MEEVENYSQKITSQMRQYEQYVLSSNVYDSNRIKWKQTCVQKQRKLKNLILQMKQEMEELPSSTAATFNITLKDHQTKLAAIVQEYQRKLKAPVKTQTMRKQSHKTQQQDNLESNRTVQSYINRGDKQIARMKDAVQNMQSELQQGIQLAQNINMQLNRQIQQLDNIQDKVKDTGATLKRAQKTINFFVKAAQCDKCVLGLVISIILALLAFIVLIVKKG